MNVAVSVKDGEITIGRLQRITFNRAFDAPHFSETLLVPEHVNTRKPSERVSRPIGRAIVDHHDLARQQSGIECFWTQRPISASSLKAGITTHTSRVGHRRDAGGGANHNVAGKLSN